MRELMGFVGGVAVGLAGVAALPKPVVPPQGPCVQLLEDVRFEGVPADAGRDWPEGTQLLVIGWDEVIEGWVPIQLADDVATGTCEHEPGYPWRWPL